jgi:hypothetical protein
VLAAGCYAVPHEAGPTILCGQNLAGGDVSPFVDDVTAGNPTVAVMRQGEITFVRLTESCDHGVDVAFRPGGAATILRRVDAADGRPVALAVQLNRTSFVMVLRQDGQAPRTVTFSPSRQAPGAPTQAWPHRSSRRSVRWRGSRATPGTG